MLLLVIILAATFLPRVQTCAATSSTTTPSTTTAEVTTTTEATTTTETTTTTSTTTTTTTTTVPCPGLTFVPGDADAGTADFVPPTGDLNGNMLTLTCPSGGAQASIDGGEDSDTPVLDNVEGGGDATATLVCTNGQWIFTAEDGTTVVITTVRCVSL